MYFKLKLYIVSTSNPSIRTTYVTGTKLSWQLSTSRQKYVIENYSNFYYRISYSKSKGGEKNSSLGVERKQILKVLLRIMSKQYNVFY